MGGTLNFPLGEAKSQWGDANYRWGDAYLLQFKYWLYFQSQAMAYFHYYDTATVRNQHQLLTCKTYILKNYYFYQKLYEMQYLNHFRA